MHHSSVSRSGRWILQKFRKSYIVRWGSSRCRLGPLQISQMISTHERWPVISSWSEGMVNLAVVTRLDGLTLCQMGRFDPNLGQCLTVAPPQYAQFSPHRRIYWKMMDYSSINRSCWRIRQVLNIEGHLIELHYAVFNKISCYELIRQKT